MGKDCNRLFLNSHSKYFLSGELDIASATIQIQDAVLLTVNPAAAMEQGIELPASLIDRADTVIDG